MPWILPTSCLETIDKNAARHRDGLRFLEMFHVKQTAENEPRMFHVKHPQPVTAKDGSPRAAAASAEHRRNREEYLR